MRHLLLLMLPVSVVLSSARSFAAISSPTQPECAAPVEDVGLDMHLAAAFAYTQSIKIVNLYWSDHWNSIPGNPRFQDINAATQKLVDDSLYFRHTCQYGSPSIYFDRGIDTSGANPCAALGSNGPPTSRPIVTDIENFLTCEEAMPFTGLPVVQGVPTPLIPGSPGFCPTCGVVFPCYLDAACRAAPNPTGNMIVNIFVPAGARPVTSECNAYHFQAPTWAIGWPFFPVPLTWARPIYYTVIPVDCNQNDIAALMENVAHEMVETLTDEFPGAFWYTRHNNASVASEAEAADICQSVVRPDGSDWERGSNGAPKPENDRAHLDWVDTSGALQTMTLAGYWSNKDNACIAPTVSRGPAVSITIIPAPNRYGWNNSPVTIVLNATDGSGIPIAGIHYQWNTDPEVVVASNTVSLNLSTEGTTTLTFYAINATGQFSAFQQIEIKISTAKPLMSVTPSPSPNAAGWNNTSVSLNYECSSCGVFPIECPPSRLVTTEGAEQTFVDTMKDGADNTNSITSTLNIDKTPPTITYVGARVYGIDETVNVECIASDALSGIAATTCATINGPAYNYPTGPNPVSASATDVADNSTTATASFSVVVTSQGICNLATQFSNSSGVANAACAHLASIASAPTPPAKAGKLNAFDNFIDAQTGKAFTAAQSAILKRLASTI